MKIVAKDGCVFALKDRSAVYDNIMYLGIYDSIENYIEITYAEAEVLRKELEEKSIAEMEDSLNG